MTSTTIIHLKRISPDQPVPAGFSGPLGSTAVQGRTFLTWPPRRRLAAGS